MKFIAFLSLALLTACTSKMIQMTPEETTQFYKDRPNAYSYMKDGHKSIVDSPDYCDASGRCWNVECHGNTSEVTCWKTPTELSDAIFNAAKEDAARSPEAFLAKCESTQETPANRRAGCFEYLSVLQKFPESTLNTDAPRILKLFCDMKDVTCTKNYKKFGKGNLNTDGMGKSIKKGLYQIASKTSSGEPTSYEYSILK
ncbi:hypothetical protein [Bdellovibrio sp. HCB337]|uniref:hypothetical protein n=1 Tax=Bdellovibrio sp. HCB337 TaxID=3394358 RepID=UPI0039A58EF9